ncbi:MAG TPA: hypothetical protein DCZ80_04250 [Legionellales bacterium]|nr:hypothetical protein [Legionellales bacterium]
MLNKKFIILYIGIIIEKIIVLSYSCDSLKDVINRRGGRIMFKKSAKKFEDLDAYKPKRIGILCGLGIYGAIALIAPSVFVSFSMSTSALLAGFLGASLSMAIGFIIPLAAIVAATVVTVLLIAYAIKEAIKNAIAKHIPGGRYTIDAMENVAETGMGFAKGILSIAK